MTLKSLVEKYISAPDWAGSSISTVHSRTPHGDQMIHMACVTGDIHDVKELLELGANLMSSGENGYTPLHYAIEQGNIDLARYLISIGADPLYKNHDGETPTDFAKLLNIAL